ncbi:MAG: endolytic transglycosylase MltG [Acidimicrobiia bacterium]
MTDGSGGTGGVGDETRDQPVWPPVPPRRSPLPGVPPEYEADDQAVPGPEPTLTRAEQQAARSSRPAREPRAPRRRQRRRGLAVFLVLALLLLPFLLVAGWMVWELHPPGGQGSEVTVVIESGWGTKEAGDALQAKGVIGSSLAFQLWSKASGAGTFQAGTYRLPTGMGVGEAADALSAGPQSSAGDHYTLALPPGLRLEQIADRVGQLPGHSRDAFLALAQSGAVKSRYQSPQQSVEGFTWPDTYFIGKQQTDQQILETIVAEFDKHADAVGLGTAAPAEGLTPQQAVVVASLVQAEAGGSADASKVAAVILNRFRQGTPLQIDATLCYSKGGCPPVPNNADKQIDSPYNTYRVTGLPPTPIMTVTEPALQAALHPADVPYLFYVTGKDGVTYFATTLAEHEANIRAHGVSGE